MDWGAWIGGLGDEANYGKDIVPAYEQLRKEWEPYLATEKKELAEAILKVVDQAFAFETAMHNEFAKQPAMLFYA